MSVNDDMIEAGSDSFWEINQWRRTTKRTDDSFDLCTKLCSLIQERSDIEKAYSSNLKKWSQKWNQFLEKGPEYGTMQESWQGFLGEADRMSFIHNDIKTKLLDDVQSQIKSFQKENFQKTSLPPQRIKQTKDYEDKFTRAQKPWAKKYKRLLDCKKEYHNACKMAKTYKQQHLNAKNDPNPNADQIKKLQDKVSKAEKECDISKQSYETSIRDLDAYNPKYMEEMTEVFELCQDFEKKRLTFFRSVLQDFHSVLNISNNKDLPQVYDDLSRTILNADSDKDLRWWAQHHGTDMPMNWPAFEEYSPDLVPISKKKGNGGDSLGPADGGVTLKSINTSRQGSFRSQDSGSRSAIDTYDKHDATASSAGVIDQGNRGNASNGGALPSYQRDSMASVGSQDSPAGVVRNPFGDENDLATADDDHAVSIFVRALYDYVGAEDDELSFSAGDVFEKLDNEDEQGWCKGRINNVEGLYPANYVKEI